VITVLVLGKSSYENLKDVALASRAFGANSIIFTTNYNSKLVRYFKTINSKWGGNFEVRFEKDWRAEISRKKNYEKVYLTMDGVPINKIIYRIKTYKNILLIASFQNAQRSVKEAVDFNVSITTQPHSTVSSVAVFMHMFYSGRELAIRFKNAKHKIKQAKI